jgi:hypothetical protein
LTHCHSRRSGQLYDNPVYRPLLTDKRPKQYQAIADGEEKRHGEFYPM